MPRARTNPEPCHPAHPDHSAELRRLSRIRGQLEGVRKMIEENRYCPDILVQTSAIRAALRGLETSMLERHLRHCVSDAFSARRPDQAEAKIEELVDLYRKGGA